MRHIRVAIGRDYADVPPTRGVFKGTSAVKSELSRLGQRRIDRVDARRRNDAVRAVDVARRGGAAAPTRRAPTNNVRADQRAGAFRTALPAYSAYQPQPSLWLRPSSSSGTFG